MFNEFDKEDVKAIPENLSGDRPATAAAAQTRAVDEIVHDTIILGPEVAQINLAASEAACTTNFGSCVGPDQGKDLMRLRRSANVEKVVR